MANEVKRWRVKYSHNDGRSGEVEAITKVSESGAFQYGNGKAGALIVDGYTYRHDLRYCKEKDLHMVMLKEYFGNGLVTAIEV